MVQLLRLLGLTAVTATKAPAAAAWPVPAFGPWPTDDAHHHVVVVGAGIGGLSAAALLARHGLKVLVLEAHDRPGGYCSSWTRTVRRGDQRLSYRFDAGVQDISGLGPRGPLHQLLQRLGAPHRIEWRRVRHLYALHGQCFDVPQEAGDLIAHLTAAFPAEAAGIDAFFRQITAVYREMYQDIEQTGGIPMPPSGLAAALAWPERHPHAWQWMNQPFAAMLDAFFADRRLKELLTVLSDYITDRSETLSVADMAPLFGYYCDGGFYPLGGAQTLANLLCEIIGENGGRVLLRHQATRILVEDGWAAGVETADGVRYRASLVLANGDVRVMLETLLGADHLPPAYLRRLRGMRRGPSAILLSLGVDRQPDLPARIFVHHDGLAFGIGNPSAVDPSLAPAGHAALTMLCLLSEEDAAGWDRSADDYRMRKEHFADRLIAATEATVWPDCGRHIVTRQIASPATFRRYARTCNGNVYGAARGQWCPATKTPVPGLMAVGAGTASGAGIEAVVVSGTMAANLVLQDRPFPVFTAGERA